MAIILFIGNNSDIWKLVLLPIDIISSEKILINKISVRSFIYYIMK